MAEKERLGMGAVLHVRRIVSVAVAVLGIALAVSGCKPSSTSTVEPTSTVETSPSVVATRSVEPTRSAEATSAVTTSAAGSSVPGSIALRSSLRTSAKRWANGMMSGKGKPYGVTFVEVARGKSGTWWGRAIVQPSGTSTNQYEALEFWCAYAGDTWSGQPQDPEPPEATTYFPAEVVGKLFP